jgi:superfamily II DNA or RNA helicase
MVITIKQVNAHNCRVDNRQQQYVVWKVLSYYDQGADMTKSILDCRGNHGCRFPVGLYPYVYHKLKEDGHLVIYKPLSYSKINYKLRPSLPGVTFEDYQIKMLAPIGIKSRGIIIGPTGSGKTIVMGGIIDKLKTPKTIIITPTKQILNQTYNNFINWFPNHKIGKIGDGEKTIGHITVALFQSLKKIRIKGCQLVIIDECHRMNNSIDKILRKLPDAHYRYGLTATPQLQKDFGKWGLMTGNIAPIIYEVSDRQAINRVTDVQINLLRFICTRPTGGNYQEVLRNDVLYSMKRCSKMLRAAQQLSLNKGGNCLILLDEIEQGNVMMKEANKMGLEPLFAHGKRNNEQNDFIKNLLNRRKIQLVIATSVFGIGTDIPNIDCVGLASSRKSYIDTVQKIGRGRRRVEGKNKLIVIDFVDNVRGKHKFHKHFYAHSIERLNTYKDKEWEIKKLYII